MPVKTFSWTSDKKKRSKGYSTMLLKVWVSDEQQSPGNLSETKILRLQATLGLNPRIYVLTSPPGDSGAGKSLKATRIKHMDFRTRKEVQRAWLNSSKLRFFICKLCQKNIFFSNKQWHNFSLKCMASKWDRLFEIRTILYLGIQDS